jgi:hypothetical protein
MRTVLVLIIFMLASICSAEVYKTVDKDGNIVYSDNPKSDKAEKIELRELNTVPSASPSYSPDPSNSAEPQQIRYQIEVISPRDNVIIPVSQRDLAIAVNLDQPLQAGHLLVYFMNGELVEETIMTNILIKDVARMSHKITVEAIDENGQSLGISTPVTVTFMGPANKKPASTKPTPKPKPKPAPKG